MDTMNPLKKKSAFRARKERTLCGGLLLLAVCAAIGGAGCTDPTSHDLTNQHDPLSNAYVAVPVSHAAIPLVSETRRILSWKDSSHFESRYLIERKLGELGVFETIGMPPANSTYFIDSAIIRTDTTYYYRIMALSEGDKKGEVATVSARLPFPAPSSLSIHSVSPSAATLRWSDNSAFEKGFILERHERNGVYAERGRVGENVTSFSEMGLDLLKDYFYRVKAFTPNNESRSSNEIIAAYFPAASEEVYRNYMYGGYQVIQASPDGHFFFVGGRSINGHSGYGDIIIIDMVKQKVALGNHGTQIRWIAMSWDERYVASFSNDNMIRVWNSADLSAVKAFPSQLTVVRAAYSRDGSKLICACADSVIRCLNAEDGSLLYATPARGRAIASLVVSPDGESFACASGGQVEVFALADGSLRRQLPALPAAVTLLKYAPDNTLGALSGGNRIDLWKGGSGELLQTITGFTTTQNALTFTDDSRYVMTYATTIGDAHGVVPIWRIRDKQLVRIWPYHLDGYRSATSILFTVAGSNLVGTFDGHQSQELMVYPITYQWDAIAQ